MSLLKDYSPKRTRQRKNESQERKIDLPEIHSSPKKEIKKTEEVPQDLIQQYAYHPKSKEEKKDKIISEQLLESSNCSKGAKPKNTFGFFELSLMCEEHLLTSLYGPFDEKLKKIYDLQKKCIIEKLEIISEYSKEIEFELFKDNIYYFKGDVLIPEEYLSLTGFLREYMKLEQVAILYNTGEILLQETGYCNFWFEDRLKKFFNNEIRELSHTEILDANDCLKCWFNWNCPFARIQQMSIN
jgi:hypothetical protein